MGNEVQNFDFQGNQIRSIVKEEDGSIWFVASDCCKILGLNNVGQVLTRLYDKEKNYITKNEAIKTRGTNRLTIISESGLYKLILRSNKPEAIKFQDWITQEVLPAIRKDGGYINFGDGRDPVQIAEGLLQLAKQQSAIIAKQKTEIEELKPQAQLADSFFNSSDDNINFNTMAKLAKFITVDDQTPVGGRLLKEECISQGLIGKRDRIPNQLYINNGYFKVFYSKVFNRQQGWITASTTLITPKGQKWLYNKMLKVFNKAA